MMFTQIAVGIDDHGTFFMVSGQFQSPVCGHITTTRLSVKISGLLIHNGLVLEYGMKLGFLDFCYAFSTWLLEWY